VIHPPNATLDGLLLATLLLGEKIVPTRAIGALIIVCGLLVIGAEAVTRLGSTELPETSYLF
jgi:drug/metabolite transporter (DMT)-like permease